MHLRRFIGIKDILNNNTLKICLIMAILNIGCKSLGFFRQMLLAKYFGTGNVTDAYVMAQSIPNILFGGILVSFGASYMPLLSRRYEFGGKNDANEYTSKIIVILFILSVIITSFGIIFAKQITSIMAGGLNNSTKELTSHYLIFTFGYTFFAATAGIYSSFLQYKGIFICQIAGDYIQNIFFIVFIWIAYYLNSKLLILGLFFGYIMRGIYLRRLVSKNDFKFSFKPDGILHDFNEMKNFAIPIFISTTADEINSYVDRFLASHLDSGSVSALNYAQQLRMVFIELTTTILVTIIFPKLVYAYTTNQKKLYRNYVRKGIVLCSMVAIPLTIGSVVFSRQIIACIFERGYFSAGSTVSTANAFLFYSIGIISLAICLYMSKVFYASSDMRTPMICAMFSVVVNIIGNFFLVQYMNESGLALATSISNTINAILLLILYNQKIRLFKRNVIWEIIKIIFSAIFSIKIAYFLYDIIITNLSSQKIVFIIICLICAFIYFILLYIFDVKEFKEILHVKGR